MLHVISFKIEWLILMIFKLVSLGVLCASSKNTKEDELHFGLSMKSA